MYSSTFYLTQDIIYKKEIFLVDSLNSAIINTAEQYVVGKKKWLDHYLRDASSDITTTESKKSF